MKKRPTGLEWEKFVESWYKNDHDGKVILAQAFGVTYETLKHWVSNNGATRKKVEEPTMHISIPELLGSQPCVNLDFVCFDIETSNLQADFSITMTACIKPYGLPPIVFRADNYPEWTENRSNDKGIITDISAELRKHAIVIAHYGSKFDVPFLRAKMVKHHLDPLPPMFGIDTWRIAWNNFKVSSRRLANLSTFFDIGEKEPVEGALWMTAAYDGSKEAMDKIVSHNIRDVEILEKLACISFPYIKSIPRL
jgi:uncharacterized protein YprB with RNaseH-like and TPR domain